MNWNLFHNKEKERADKLEAQVQALLKSQKLRDEKEAEEKRVLDLAIKEANKTEKRVLDLAIKEANKTEKLVQEEKERANKLEAQVQVLLESQKLRDEKEAEEKRILDLAIEEANKTERLVQEEKERKEAEKTLATEKGEPYINIVSIDMEPGDTANIGAIEMDWNENFIKMLQQNGYIGVSDEDAVDQWFRDVCKHVILETYEDASEEQKITRTGLNDGRAEYS